jgi:hypothetical protein
MGIFQDIERLITEHGSAAILRERLTLAAEQYAALEKKVVELQAENERLESENFKLQEQVRNFKSSPAQNSNPDGYVCDHCGSSNLKRTGSRPDPVFGDLGAKQAVFRCNECGGESSFLQDPR